MPNNHYNILKQTLELEIAAGWLLKDAEDDFFPDAICYSELKDGAADYLSQKAHRLFQFDAVQFRREYVPKKTLLLREAIWLPPSHRILYLAILKHLFRPLDIKLLDCAYSYRCDSTANEVCYPFNDKKQGWIRFQNDFRKAAIATTANAIVVTDLASYYDHISCEQMCTRIQSLYGSTISEPDEAVIDLLHNLLKFWSNDRYGIPQNYDTSSFLGSLYLHYVDYSMISQGYQYFRFVDDIRLVTNTKEEAILALHGLQTALASHRLFLATDKTHIYTKDNPKYSQLLDVKDDELLSRAELTIRAGAFKEIEAIICELFDCMEKHSVTDGDERKFRAALNRLLSISEFSEFEQKVIPIIQKFVLPRLKIYPDRSDRWVKALRKNTNITIANTVKELLITKPSVFVWQRFQLWGLALYLGSFFDELLLNKAMNALEEEPSDLVISQAILCVGKYGNNTQKETLFRKYFTPERSYVIQRAILLAIQELPTSPRNELYSRALEINSEHTQLVSYLKRLDAPNYGIKAKVTKNCADSPIISKVPGNNDGIGLIDGNVVQYPLVYGDEDYS